MNPREPVVSTRSRYTLADGRLEQRFVAKNSPLSASEASAEAYRCLYCHDAPCIESCPTAIDIPTFIRKIATGNMRGAARTILSANLLGGSCARVCPVEVLCESTCVFHQWDRPPIAIGRLQRHAIEHGAAADLFSPSPPTGRSVGLVGAGPASLACGAALALWGHEAIVYERATLPGGLNSTGVAPYKQTLKDAIGEIDFLLEFGLKIETGVEVGVDLDADELLRRHDAIFLGPGLGADSRLGVTGEDGPGVVGAVAWIGRLKTDPTMTTDGVAAAVVVGGGNTAVDVARELLGLGVATVTMVYRRSADEMSAYRHELDAARCDGLRLIERAAVTEVVRDGAAVGGVRLVETDGGVPSGRDLGTCPADLVVVAIGQGKLAQMAAQFEGVVLDDKGRIAVDAVTGGTGNPRVFAGGDATNGGKEVVNAVDEGQRAAAAIDAILRAPSPQNPSP